MRLFEKWAMRSPLRVWIQRRVEAPRVLGGLDLPAGATCLEIGCGHGAGALLISSRLGCGRLVGVDLDPQMLRWAARTVARPPRWAAPGAAAAVRLLAADAARLPLPDACFDAAFLFGVLHHIPAWREALAEVFRVLKPGGLFSFEEALAADSFWSFNWFYRHVPFDEGELLRAISDAGFSILRFERARLTMPVTFIRARRPG